MSARLRLRWFLLVVLIVSAVAAAIWAAWESFIIGRIDFVNVFAGSAAVIAAAISASVAFRTAELTEERLRPYPYPFIDTSSRYGLAQLRIRNVGGTAAHTVYLEWTGESLPRMHVPKEGSEVPLLANGKSNAIAVLLPYESLAQVLDAPHKVAQQAKSEGSHWHGFVHFIDSRGQAHKNPFMLDVTNLGRGLLYDSEKPRALFELQKLPDKIRELTSAVRALNRDSNKYEERTDDT